MRLLFRIPLTGLVFFVTAGIMGAIAGGGISQLFVTVFVSADFWLLTAGDLRIPRPKLNFDNVIFTVILLAAHAYFALEVFPSLAVPIFAIAAPFHLFLVFSLVGDERGKGQSTTVNIEKRKPIKVEPFHVLRYKKRVLNKDKDFFGFIPRSEKDRD